MQSSRQDRSRDRLHALRRRCAGRLAATLFAVACAMPSAVHAAGAPGVKPPANTIRIAKSRVLVQPKAGLSNAEFDKIVKAHGGRRVERLGPLDVHVIELPAQASEIAVARALRGNPHIKFAEPDMGLQPDLYVNDPHFSNAWHLPKIGATSAWDTGIGKGVVIAILDSGIDAAHPDLQPQLVPGYNVFDNNANTADVYGHGTVVAGIAAAAGDNALGVAGVAFGARIMPIRVTDLSGYAYYSTLAKGITFAADNGARVANISFQGASASSTVLSAAQYMRSKGGVVVTSAGNTGGQLSYAATDYMTVVGASDANNNRASFSSYGSFVDLAAPGVGIYATTRGGGYSTVSGTSASSPVTAAVYGLLLSANAALTPAVADGIVFETATDVGTSGKDVHYGWGVVDAQRAMTLAAGSVTLDTQAPTVSITSPSAGSKITGLVPVGVDARDDTGVAKVELLVDNRVYATDTSSPFGFSLDTSTLPEGAATLVARAYDARGNQATSASVSVTVANDTVAPEVSIQSPSNGATVSGAVSISASASDNVKVREMSLSIDGKQVALVYGSSLSYSWSPPKKRGGWKQRAEGSTHGIQVSALDTAGNKGTASVSVTVK